MSIQNKPGYLPLLLTLAASGCAPRLQHTQYLMNRIPEIRSAPHLMAEGATTRNGIDLRYRVEQWDAGAHTGRCEASILARLPDDRIARVDATSYSGEFLGRGVCDFNHMNVNIKVDDAPWCVTERAGCRMAERRSPEESYLHRLAADKDKLTREVNSFFSQGEVQRVSSTPYRGFGRPRRF